MPTSHLCRLYQSTLTGLSRPLPRRQQTTSSPLHTTHHFQITRNLFHNFFYQPRLYLLLPVKPTRRWFTRCPGYYQLERTQPFCDFFGRCRTSYSSRSISKTKKTVHHLDPTHSVTARTSHTVRRRRTSFVVLVAGDSISLRQLYHNNTPSPTLLFQKTTRRPPHRRRSSHTIFPTTLPCGGRPSQRPRRRRPRRGTKSRTPSYTIHDDRLGFRAIVQQATEVG